MEQQEAGSNKQFPSWEEIRKRWPKKFRDQERFIFQEIRPGDRIFVGTGCGEPQYLVSSLLNFVKNQPKAFLDAELILMWPSSRPRLPTGTAI